MEEGTTFAILIVLGYLVATMASSKQTEEGSLVSEGTNSLCNKLYQALRSKSGNIFYSPASLEFALALVYAGAEGTTAKEIRNVLHLPESKEKAYAAVADSLNGLIRSSSVTLKVADGLFVQKDFKVRQSFVDIAKKYFASEVMNVNFTEVEAAKTINGFVAKETNQKITELFKPDAFDSLTRVVIANAVYFKGNWEKKFNPSSTFKGDFHLNKQDKVKVDFMKQEASFDVGYSEDLKANIVVLPYKGKEMSMILIVPDEIDGLKKVEEKLPDMNLMDLLKNTYSQTVVLTMPKFKLMDDLKLKSILCELGMLEMFTDRANLSGIAEEPLFVSDVVQKSFIEVNEEGAEAAAATGIVAQVMCLPMDIIIDRPFLFLIYNSCSRMTMFFGRLCKF